ncbi:MAG TPA: hypothetical protein VG675_18020 [Bryobacteraceae bacterium]|nr:hypothetical protein [Bryobacteraceae bacterium]
MTKIGSAATAKVIERITGSTGVNSTLGALTQPDSGLAGPIMRAQVNPRNASADVVGRSGPAKFPTINVYCEKIVNNLMEKFRSFSGNVQMAIEIRHSQDRLDGLEAALELYIDSATQMLDSERGDWGDGMYYAGGYEVTFGPVKSGGRNLIQTAKIMFEIGVSKN